MKQQKGINMEQIIIACIITAVVTSLLTTKIMATYYFKIIDDYVKSMVDMSKDLLRTTYFNK